MQLLVELDIQTGNDFYALSSTSSVNTKCITTKDDTKYLRLA